MTDKPKVSDLPEKERAALINEAKELGIRGLYNNMYAETLRNKVAEAKASKSQNAASADAGNELQSAPADAGNKRQAAPADTAETDDTQTTLQAPKVTKTADKLYEATPQKASQTKICHICRSKVINGICTGCGFKLRNHTKIKEINKNDSN